MRTINEIQDEVIEEFEGLDDWMDRYQLLIDLGNELEPLDDKYKTEQNLIDGCQSRVWIQCDKETGDGRQETGDGGHPLPLRGEAGRGLGDRLVFSADSDALIVKGIIALLLRVLSNHTPEEILDADLYFIDRIGLRDHLSPTRANGLVAMVKRIKAYALVNAN